MYLPHLTAKHAATPTCLLCCTAHMSCASYLSLQNSIKVQPYRHTNTLGTKWKSL